MARAVHQPAHSGSARGRGLQLVGLAGGICDNAGSVALQICPIGSPPIVLPDRLDVDVLVFPREAKDDIGLYQDSVITFAKELREEGENRRLPARSSPP